MSDRKPQCSVYKQKVSKSYQTVPVTGAYLEDPVDIQQKVSKSYQTKSMTDASLQVLPMYRQKVQKSYQTESKTCLPWIFCYLPCADKKSQSLTRLFQCLMLTLEILLLH